MAKVTDVRDEKTGEIVGGYSVKTDSRRREVAVMFVIRPDGSRADIGHDLLVIAERMIRLAFAEQCWCAPEEQSGRTFCTTCGKRIRE